MLRSCIISSPFNRGLLLVIVRDLVSFNSLCKVCFCWLSPLVPHSHAKKSRNRKETIRDPHHDESLVSPCHIAQVQPCDCTSAKENYSWRSSLPSMCMHNGWLIPEALLGSHGNSEFKLPKARILLGWLNFPTCDFWCTVPPIVHPIIVGVFR